MVINSLLHRTPPSIIPTPASPLVHVVGTTWHRHWHRPRQSPVLAQSECRTTRVAHHGSRIVPNHRTAATTSDDQDWQAPDPVAVRRAGQYPAAFRSGVRDCSQTHSPWHSL